MSQIGYSRSWSAALSIMIDPETEAGVLLKGLASWDEAHPRLTGT